MIVPNPVPVTVVVVRDFSKDKLPPTLGEATRMLRDGEVVVRDEHGFVLGIVRWES